MPLCHYEHHYSTQINAITSRLPIHLDKTTTGGSALAGDSPTQKVEEMYQRLDLTLAVSIINSYSQPLSFLAIING